jgi:hypothetical protein
MPLGFPPAGLENPTPEEEAALAAVKHYQDWDSGYMKQQSTRPQTLGYGLVDSPITHWTTMPRGGHFAAFEQPGLFVDDVSAFFDTVR